MIDKIIAFSTRSPWTIGLLILVLIIWGSYSLSKLPIDAVPDVTTNQVDIITNSPNLSSLEIEMFITTPIEMAMANIPSLLEIRSNSKFGSSVVKLIFTDETDIYWARQQVFERLEQVKSEIPEGAGSPILGPVSTGLGEIFQYVIRPVDMKNSKYTLTEIRTIQDWVVRKRLLGLPGVADVSGYGGYSKEYQAKIKPERMKALGITVDELYDALAKGNSNTGGAYIEKDNKAYTIRGIGLAKTLDDIANIVIKTNNHVPVLVKDVADVEYGHALRYGALTMNGAGDVVGGSILMMKGANGNQVIGAIKERMEEIQQDLPDGLIIEPFVDRSKLVNNAIKTVATNLIEGALIVVVVILLLLGNWRASLLAASVIPLSMLFAFIWMNYTGVVGNIMSLGAIDFGLLVDPAIIVVEAAVLFLAIAMQKKQRENPGISIDYKSRQDIIIASTAAIKKSVIFGGLIILIVYVPILALQGVEGKMFSPMAKTVGYAIIGALILSVTYVPMMSALILKPSKSLHHNDIGSKIVTFFTKIISRILSLALQYKKIVIAFAIGIILIGYVGFSRIGGEFIPKLQEGDMLIDMNLPIGTPLTESISQGNNIQLFLLKEYPDEIERLVSKIGTSEVKVDPLPLESQEIYVVLKDKKHWTKTKDQEELAVMVNESMKLFPGIILSIQQPIESRVNDMMSGARTDVVVQLYGPDLDTLVKKGNEIIQLVKTVPGAVDVQENKVFGLPQINIEYDRKAMALYGVKVAQINRAVQTAFGGATAGVIYENDKRFDLTLRLVGEERVKRENIENLMIEAQNGSPVPLKELAAIKENVGPSEIGHEGLQRRVNLGFNVRGRDLESVVNDVIKVVDENVKIDKDYKITYGGEFENFSRAKKTLAIVVPVALLIILGLLYLTFGNFKDSLLIYSVVPLSAVGGVLSLLLRDMNFSISAGVGFIALFGVAVLNGILLISHFNELAKQGITNLDERVKRGIEERIRPVLMTSLVAALGFMPMALSTSVGAEVQKPLATVVIGGLIISTALTLFVLPVLYTLFTKNPTSPLSSKNSMNKYVLIFMILGLQQVSSAQQLTPLTRNEVLQRAQENNPKVLLANLKKEKQSALKASAISIPPTEVIFEAPTSTELRPGILQTFNFPTTYIRQYQAQNKQLEVANTEKAITLNQLRYNVKTVYNEMQYLRDVLTSYKQQDSLLEDFVEVTDVRLSVGQISNIERLNAESQYREVKYQLGQVMARLRTSQLQMGLLIGTPGDTSIRAKDDFTKENIPAETLNTESVFRSNPLVNWYEQNRKLQHIQLNAEKSKWFPNLIVGYLNQEPDNGPVRMNYRMRYGFTIPLWFWTTSSRVKAARKDLSIAEQQVVLNQYELHGSYNQAVSELKQYTEALNYYEQTGLPQAEEIAKTAREGYRLGSIGYYNYLLNLQQVIKIRLGYLEALKNYNQAIYTIQYLSGQ